MEVATAGLTRYRRDFVQKNNFIEKPGLEDSSYYYPLLVSILSCTFALVFVVRNSFYSGLERSKPGISSRSARWVCAGLFILHGLLLLVSLWEWWETAWSDVPLHELVFYGSQLLFWLILYISIQQREDLLHSTQVKTWWIFLTVLSTAGIAVAVVKRSSHDFGYVFDVALFCVPLISSVYFIALSFVQARFGGDLKTPLLKDESPVYFSTTPLPDSGYSKAGLLSRTTLSWLNPLLTVGNQRPLHVEDVPALDPEDDNRSNFDAFQRSWEAEGTSNSKLPSIRRALWKTFRGPFSMALIFSFIWSCALFTGPVLQNLLIDFMNEEKRSFTKGLILVGILFTGKVMESLARQHYNFRSRKLGLRMWSAVGCAVYMKTLRLSLTARQNRSVGEITNIFSSDVQRLLEFPWYFIQGMAISLQIVLASILLFKVVGMAMVVGVVTIFTVLSINIMVVRKMRNHRFRLLSAKDRRMQVTSECLGNMKMVKLQAWDEKFRKKILDAREDERSCLLKYVSNFAVCICVTWIGPQAVAALTFLGMILSGDVLTTAKVFTALTTIRIIQDPIRYFPEIFSNVLQTVVSMHRVRAFLREDEIDDDAVEEVPAGRSSYAVEMEDAAFVWDRSNASTSAIRNVNLKIKKGACVAICGGVGSGKSTLLYSMLGELPRIAGVVKRAGRSAYVAQTAWIQNDTIRENILFGRDFELDRYSEAMRVSGLEADLAQFPDGDATEIGEKGINMSGGQKQRIQLARAVYQDADTYFLDDPFSAVDAHTGTYLFEECIQGALKGKTVILVTHQVEFLPAADLIIVMKDGEIVQEGSYSELVQERKYFSTFVEALQNSLNSVTHVNDNQKEATTEFDFDTSARQNVPSKGSPEQKSTIEAATSTGTGKLIKEEERAEGRVDSKVIWLYITKVYHGFATLMAVVLQLSAIGSQLGGDVWIAWGTSHGLGRSLSIVKVYFLFLVACGTAVLVRAFLVLLVGVYTAQAFFSGMLDSIIRAPMSFFDSTPLGRILSRSSTDQAAVDLDLPILVSQVTSSTIALVGIVTVATFITPPIIGMIIVMAWIFRKLQIYYIKSARELSRLSAINEAPVYLHVNESISGASTIRAFEDQIRFKITNSKLFDNYQRAYFHNLTATSWLGLRLEFLAAFFLSSSAFLIIALPADSIAPGMAGLVISYGLSLSNILQMLVNAISNLENKMVSVERIHQYSRIESEAPAIISDRRPPGDWPSEGRIELQKLQIRYRPDMPLVLKGISFIIHPREKVGVVGRTGSGKSTLVQALFRLIEPSGGRILIDGLDITNIGLHDLRSRLGIIPQEPMLFEGTVRSNLDPFNAYSDQQLWEALEKCALAPAVRSKACKLDAAVSEQGENWSQGERQLLCLGRALLKHASILVLDEATASVDISMDAIIQSTIKQNFADCTIISVAHRIPTVIDSDRVIVLDSGYVMENSSPGRLLANERSLFAQLVLEYKARHHHGNSSCNFEELNADSTTT